MGEEKRRPVALVTGASRGIGEAIARTLAGEGYDLIVTCSKSYDDLRKAAAEIEDIYGVSCKARQVDISDPEAVGRLYQEIDELDVLVNNAGVSYVGLLSEMSAGDWRHVMSVNLDGVFYATRLAIPKMVHRKNGRILNISSVWGNVGASMEVAYSASKGAVNAFTKALAKELAPSNIAVNAIACGLIDTQMNANLGEEDIKALEDEIPADRMGRPEEVAYLAAQLLASPVYMTGQIVTIDGGWT